MSDFPNYSQTDIDNPNAPSPLYVGSESVALDIAIKRNKELHIRRRNGDNTTLSLNDLETTIEVYFDLCRVKLRTPTPAGLCAAIGINHKTLLNLLKTDDERGHIIQDALEVIHSLYQEGVVEGTIPVKTYTFMAKNYWGMSDKEIVEVHNTDGDVKIAEIDGRLNRLKLLE